MGNAGIDLIVNLGIVALIIVGVIAILRAVGVVIPSIVYTILGIVAGIVLLIWAAGFLKAVT